MPGEFPKAFATARGRPDNQRLLPSEPTTDNRLMAMEDMRSIFQLLIARTTLGDKTSHCVADPRPSTLGLMDAGLRFELQTKTGLRRIRSNTWIESEP